jgi:hypothetical protein
MSSASVLWIPIRIRKDPKLFAGSGSGTESGTQGYESRSGTGLEHYKK